MKAFVLVLALAGCLGEATIAANDLSATVFDLAPLVDQGPKLYNCLQLNNCEKACANDPKPVLCIANCRAMASPSAVAKEQALQGCFGQYCPQSTDAGTTAICTATDMGFSMACVTCISNSQVAPGNVCSDAGTSSGECHQCYDDAVACENDQ